MKILWLISVLIGIVCFVGIFAIAAYSQQLTDTQKTFGFIVLGYIGVSLFAYGWMKLFGKKLK